MGATDTLDGFFGLWYYNEPITDEATGERRYKYSGGLGTYPQQHAPIAIHRPEVGRTYFAYGCCRTMGTELGQHELINAVSYFDHATGLLHRPVVVMRRDRLDAHENPVLCIDPAGHLLVFCPGHSSKRDAYLYRSAKPHDLHTFERVRHWPAGDNFSYPQPWWIEGQGLALSHARYEGNQRRLAVVTSPDGLDWSAWDQPVWLSRMARGSYQITWPSADGRIGAAFDVHPDGVGNPLNHRTNLYYAESGDGGRTWTAADGSPLALPLRDMHNPALVLDAAAQGRLVYLKDVGFDDARRPWVVYLTSRSHKPGPAGGPYQWWLARYRGAGAWTHHAITTSDHNYDHGSLHWFSDADARLLAPTEAGDEPWGTGGQMCLWQSTDGGATWRKLARLTNDATYSHTYARRPRDAAVDFAWLWADGRVNEPSTSRLYFADAVGRVYRMPESFANLADTAFVAPKLVAEPGLLC